MMTVANAIVARSLLCGAPCTAWAKRSNTSAIHCRIRSSSVFVMSRRYAGCFTMAATESCMAVRGQTGTVPPAGTCGTIIEPTLAVSASARAGRRWRTQRAGHHLDVEPLGTDARIVVEDHLRDADERIRNYRVERLQHDARSDAADDLGHHRHGNRKHDED